ncbi:hypothetical protein BGZ49_005121, partial [Haplosporangium sp. Z 27]
WKIVVMLRLTPIPFNLITYFFSITSIELFTVVWATCIGVLPGSCIGIWIGSLLKGLSGIDHPQLERKNLVILSMNIVLIVCAILSLSLFGKRSLRKAMKRLDQHQALTNLQEVEVVIEGAAVVIRELEDNASVPPSLRSTMIEQLAAEENDPDFYFARNGMKAAAQQRGIHDPSFSNARYSPDLEAGNSDERAESSTTSNLLGNQQQRKATQVTAQSSGFTRGEKIMFSVIAAIAFLNVYIDGHKRIGAVLFVLTYNVACMLFLPGSLFTVGAGFLFKPYPLALLIVLLGDATAAILAFIFGRYVFYDWVKGMMSKHPKFNALDQVIKDDGK